MKAKSIGSSFSTAPDDLNSRLSPGLRLNASEKRHGWENSGFAS